MDNAGEELTSAQERDRAARIRVELMESTSRHESERAQKLVDQFVLDAKSANLPAVELRARTLDGHVVKTGTTGWYIRNDHSVAIGTDGKYYQLTVPGGFWSWFTGVELTPSLPLLTVGWGGKDGETGDLKDFLGRALRSEVS
ncbi:MAG: hypothetical protein LBN10_05570 [Propionibacteriaceae bacterium]|nr:hypothetical protein [Propionibacteriaceae bacterium]